MQSATSLLCSYSHKRGRWTCVAEVAWRFNVFPKFRKKWNGLNRDKKKISTKKSQLCGCGGCWETTETFPLSVWDHILHSVIWRPRGGCEQMRCCNNITERLTGIALPLLNVTAEWNCVTSVTKCWHCFAHSSCCSGGLPLQPVCVCLRLVFFTIGSCG